MMNETENTATTVENNAPAKVEPIHLGKGRLVLGVQGSGMAVRVVPHKTDPSLLVIKSAYAGGVVDLLTVMGVPTKSYFEGTHNYVGIVEAKAFRDALPKLLDTVLDAGRQVDEKEAVVKAEAEAAALVAGGDEGEEAGDEDGNETPAALKS